MKNLFALCLLVSCARGADYLNQTVLLLDAGKGVTISNSGSGPASPYAFVPNMAAGHRIRWWGSAVSVPNHNIEGATAANPSVITLRNHGLANGLTVTLAGFAGSWTAMNGACTVSNVTFTTFTCGNNATGFTGALGTPVVMQNCTDPCSVTVNRNFGLFRFWYEEVDGSGSSLSPPKFSAGNPLPVIEPPMGAPGNWKMPIEVVGQDMYVVRNQFNVPVGAPTTGLWLYLRIVNHTYNNLMHSPDGSHIGYDTKASVQICKGTITSSCTAWLGIDNTTTTAMDEYRWYGIDMVHTIASPINTVEVYIQIPDNSITANSINNIAFPFTGCDGVTSGFRILAWNLLDSSTNIAMSQIAVSSNVATATATSHAFNVNDWILLYQAPGIHARFNGERKVTVKAANTFSFIPCTAGAPSPLAISTKSCTSPDGTYAVPVSYANLYDGTPGSVLAHYPQVAAPVMYAVRELVDPSAFVWDDPSAYTAPGGGDATRGHAYFTSRNSLHVSNLPWANHNFIAACSDCHFDDTNRADGSMVAGQDLAYFKFSNQAIIQRSMMHGLSYQQALDIATYIRSINNAASPAIARPWNGPMSGCPGLEAAPVGDWLAGGGIDCAVTYDADLEEYVAPAGSYSGWNMATGDLGWRNLPVLFPHQDWLHYPPLIHPADAYPESNFFNMAPGNANLDIYAYYKRMVAALQPQTLRPYATGFQTGYFNMNIDPTAAISGGWYGTLNNFYENFAYHNQNRGLTDGVAPPGIEPAKRLGIFQYLIQKMFETLQPNYYGMCAAAYTIDFGPAVNPYHNRCPFLGREIFDQGGELTGTFHTVMGDSFIYPKPIGRPSPSNNVSSIYLNADWWVEALIQDNGNGATIGNTLDTGYLFGFNSFVSTQRPGIFWPIASAIGVGQGGQSSICSAGSNQNCSALLVTQVVLGAGTALQWMFTSPAKQATILQGYADAALSLMNNETTAQWQAFYAGAGTLQATFCTDPAVFLAWYAPTQETTCSGWRAALPIMKTLGVSNTTLNNLVTRLNQIWDTDFAGRPWPLHDFSADLAATCSLQDRMMGDAVKWWRCSNINP